MWYIIFKAPSAFQPLELFTWSTPRPLDWRRATIFLLVKQVAKFYKRFYNWQKTIFKFNQILLWNKYNKIHKMKEQYSNNMNKNGAFLLCSTPSMFNLDPLLHTQPWCLNELETYIPYLIEIGPASSCSHIKAQEEGRACVMPKRLGKGTEWLAIALAPCYREVQRPIIFNNKRARELHVPAQQ